MLFNEKRAEITLDNQKDVERFEDLFMSPDTSEQLNKIKMDKNFKARKELIRREQRQIINFS